MHRNLAQKETAVNRSNGTKLVWDMRPCEINKDR